MNTLKEALSYLNIKKFLTDFTDLNINGGIRHRLVGTGTSQHSKVKELTPKDKASIKAGLIAYRDGLNKIIKSL